MTSPPLPERVFPINRVQIHPGLSVFGYVARFDTEGRCDASLPASGWPEACAYPRHGVGQARAFHRGRQPCSACADRRPRRSLIAGAMFKGGKLPFRIGFLVMPMLGQADNKVAVPELRRVFEACFAAWPSKQEVMEAMRERELGCQLGGPAEPGATAARGFRRRLVCVRFTAGHGVHGRTLCGGGQAARQPPEFRWPDTLPGNAKSAIAGPWRAVEFAKYAPFVTRPRPALRTLAPRACG